MYKVLLFKFGRHLCKRSIFSTRKTARKQLPCREFSMTAIQPFHEGQSRASQVAAFRPKKVLSNSVIP